MGRSPPEDRKGAGAPALSTGISTNAQDQSRHAAAPPCSRSPGMAQAASSNPKHRGNCHKPTGYRRLAGGNVAPEAVIIGCDVSQTCGASRSARLGWVVRFVIMLDSRLDQLECPARSSSRESPIVTSMAAVPSRLRSCATMAGDSSIPCTRTPRRLRGNAIRVFCSYASLTVKHNMGE
jgi:hypothetical protein